MAAMKIAQIASLASLDVMCLNGRSSLQLTFDGLCWDCHVLCERLY